MANIVIKFGSDTVDLSLPAVLNVSNLGPFLPATITVPAGNNPIDGVLTTGTTPVWSIVGKGGAYIVVTKMGGYAPIAKFAMNDLAAANTGLSALLVEIGNGVPAVSLTAAGVVTAL